MIDPQQVEAEGPFLDLVQRFRELILRHRHSIVRLEFEGDTSRPRIVGSVWYRNSNGDEYVVRRNLFACDALDGQRCRYLAEYGNELLVQAEYDDAPRSKPAYVGEDFGRVRGDFLLCALHILSQCRRCPQEIEVEWLNPTTRSTTSRRMRDAITVSRHGPVH
jgi:hypothetical protein